MFVAARICGAISALLMLVAILGVIPPGFPARPGALSTRLVQPLLYLLPVVTLVGAVLVRSRASASGVLMATGGIGMVILTIAFAYLVSGSGGEFMTDALVRYTVPATMLSFVGSVLAFSAMRPMPLEKARILGISAGILGVAYCPVSVIGFAAWYTGKSPHFSAAVIAMMIVWPLASAIAGVLVKTKPRTAALLMAAGAAGMLVSPWLLLGRVINSLGLSMAFLLATFATALLAAIGARHAASSLGPPKATISPR